MPPTALKPSMWRDSPSDRRQNHSRTSPWWNSRRTSFRKKKSAVHKGTYFSHDNRYLFRYFTPSFMESPFYRGKLTLFRIAKRARTELFIRRQFIRRRFALTSLSTLSRFLFPPPPHARVRLRFFDKNVHCAQRRDRSFLTSLPSRIGNFWNLQETNACAHRTTVVKTIYNFLSVLRVKWKN